MSNLTGYQITGFPMASGDRDVKETARKEFAKLVENGWEPHGSGYYDSEAKLHCQAWIRIQTEQQKIDIQMLETDRIDEIKRMKLCDISVLGYLIINPLDKEDIKTVGQLVEFTKEELTIIDGIGRNNIRRIEDFVKIIGLKLRSEE